MHTETIAASKGGRFWDKQAEKYEKSAISDPKAYEHTLERTRSYLQPHHRVLELGSGTGSTALRLAPQVASLTASDISSNMTQIGMRKAKAQGVTNIEFLTANLQSKQLLGQPYDVVLAFNLLHLIPDIDQALKRIFEMVAPGGLFISKTICNPSRFSLKFHAIKAVLPLMQGLNMAPFVRIEDVEPWDQRIEAQGFSLIERSNHPVHPPRRYLVARRPGS